MRRVCLSLPLALGAFAPLSWAQTENPGTSADPAATAQPEPAPQPAPGPTAPATPEPAAPPAATPAPTGEPAPPYAEPPAPGYEIEEPPLEAAAGSRSGGGGIPDFGVRVDPLNWLLFGRMGLELEVELLEWLTLEAVPVFVTNEAPVLLPEELTQHSNGLGPIAGVGVGAGFWLSGDSFNGTVLRAAYNHYSFEYRSEFDQLAHTEQRIAVLLGSHRTWSWFTLAGAFGLTYETNQENRCFDGGTPTTSGCGRNELLLQATSTEFVNVNSGLHPYDFVFRFSLGVAID